MLDFPTKLNMDKVRDHCHVTGKFRRTPHNKCNINLRLPRKLPIISHNFQGYDGRISLQIMKLRKTKNLIT